MTPEEITSRLAPLYSTFINLAALTDNERPVHLAHYTSLDVLEKIMQTNEIWFSNPLFMSDHQEMRFVLFEAFKVITELQNDKDALSLDGIVERVVLGPTHSSFAATLARRMFTSLGKPGFASKVWVSEIPYGPT